MWKDEIDNIVFFWRIIINNSSSFATITILNYKTHLTERVLSIIQQNNESILFGHTLWNPSSPKLIYSTRVWTIFMTQVQHQGCYKLRFQCIHKIWKLCFWNWTELFIYFLILILRLKLKYDIYFNIKQYTTIEKIDYKTNRLQCSLVDIGLNCEFT